MIGSYIDMTSEEALASSIYRSPVRKKIHQQNVFSNYLSLKNGLVLFWNSKQASSGKSHYFRGTICLLHVRTTKFIKKFHVNSKILNIIHSLNKNEVLIFTDQGFYQWNGCSGLSLASFHKAPGIYSSIPLAKYNLLLIFRNLPTLRVSVFSLQYHQEMLLLDYGFSGEIIPNPLFIENQDLILYFSDINDQDPSNFNFKKTQANVLFTMFNYGSQKMLQSSVHKFQGISIVRLNSYYAEKKCVLLEYTTRANNGRYLALWKLENKGFLEIKKLNMDYFSNASFKSMFLTVKKDYERICLLVEKTSQKQIREDLDCESSSVSIVTLNTKKFEIEACTMLTSTEFAYSVELIKHFDEESQLFIGTCKNTIMLLDDGALSKKRFEKSTPVNEFENWLAVSKVPAKVKKIILSNDIDY
mmetsp:Transcript_22465/g.26014  ORF Transcript_22465/g.26014 Transcript_22465/m.26014 type:complete len:415 (+) Transcript_22465:69-1313(+)